MHGDPTDGELDRVAAAMDAELRAEQAAYEAMALQSELRGRSLADVARDLVVRGDRVRVDAAGTALVGVLVHAGRDVGVLDTARGPADLHLPLLTALHVVERVRAGGRPPGRGPATFRARMTEHETSGAPVAVLVVGGTAVEGRIVAAAVDHLWLTTRRGDVAVPLGSVVGCLPAVG